jgi:hypothetical protein
MPHVDRFIDIPWPSSLPWIVLKEALELRHWKTSGLMALSAQIVLMGKPRNNYWKYAYL